MAPIIIIMTMLYYKSGKSIMTPTCHKSGNDYKFNNNEDKVCSLLRRWGW